MKKLFIAIACAAIIVFGGCVSDRGQYDTDNKPTVQALGYTGESSSFGDDQYIWESWQYGTNRVNRTK